MKWIVTKVDREGRVIYLDGTEDEALAWEIRGALSLYDVVTWGHGDKEREHRLLDVITRDAERRALWRRVEEAQPEDEGPRSGDPRGLQTPASEVRPLGGPPDVVSKKLDLLEQSIVNTALAVGMPLGPSAWERRPERLLMEIVRFVQRQDERIFRLSTEVAALKHRLGE